MKKRSTDNLTIVIPVYERETYFKEALESALDQTIQCNLLVVDNASTTDYFKKTCAKYNVSYLFYPDHVSMFANWNRCFANCASEYVLLLGDDDVLAADYVENFLAASARHPDMELYYTNFEILADYNGKTQIQPSQYTVPYGFQENGHEILRSAARYGMGFPVISCVIKKQIFSGFYEEFHASNDWLWTYTNIDKLKSYGEEIVQIKYRKHPAADTNNPQTRVRGLLSHAYIYEKVVAGKLKEPALRKRCLLRAGNALVQMRIADRNRWSQSLRGQENIYCRYFDDKLHKDPLVRMLFRLPRFFARFLAILNRYRLAENRPFRKVN